LPTDRGTQSPSKLAGSHGYGFGCRVGGFFSGLCSLAKPFSLPFNGIFIDGVICGRANRPSTCWSNDNCGHKKGSTGEGPFSPQLFFPQGLSNGPRTRFGV